MLKGSCIQSTRSCDPGPSISLIKEAIQAGRKFKMISVDDFPDDGIVVAVQGIGGGGPWEYVIERTKSQGLDVLSQSKRNNMVVDLLSEFVGKEVTAIIRSEAAEATATALLVAAERDIPILDAGITGRAVPEVQQSIPWISGIASIPTAIVTPWGDEIIIKNAIDEYRVEDLSRAIAVASGGDAVITMTPMNCEQIKYAGLKNNLSDQQIHYVEYDVYTLQGKDFSNLYNHKSVPSMFLLNQNGEVIQQWNRIPELVQILKYIK